MARTWHMVGARQVMAVTVIFPEKAQAFQDLALALLALRVYASLVPSVQPLLVSSVSWEPREGRDPL